MRPITFDQSKALKLYNEFKNDVEIANQFEVNKSTITSWRQRKFLPFIAHSEKKIVKKHKQGSDYRDVLTLKQSAEMNKFLKCLSDGARKANQAGIKLDVGAAINAWRGNALREGVN